ncbi:MAG: hypothetical protein HYZ42_15525, partial [Bacteroidetes bacterium]|nr:hypothetical protein [Bacteroidota bacterium]
MTKFLYIVLLCMVFGSKAHSQTTEPVIDFNTPQEYVIEEIKISGVKYLDTNVLVLISGLYKGQKVKIPGDDIRKAIESLWKQNLFDDVNILATKFQDNKVWLEINLLEKPKYYLIKIKGLRKGQAKSLREDELGFLKQNMIVNDNLMLKVKNTTLAFFRKKGYYSTKAIVTTTPLDSGKNYVVLNVDVEKGPKVK